VAQKIARGERRGEGGSHGRAAVVFWIRRFICRFICRFWLD
jgi:hypothetical protein